MSNLGEKGTKVTEKNKDSFDIIIVEERLDQKFFE